MEMILLGGKCPQSSTGQDFKCHPITLLHILSPPCKMAGVDTCHLDLPLINSLSLTSHLKKLQFPSRALWTILMGRRPCQAHRMESGAPWLDQMARPEATNSTRQPVIKLLPWSPQQFWEAHSLLASPETRNMGLHKCQQSTFQRTSGFKQDSN